MNQEKLREEIQSIAVRLANEIMSKIAEHDEYIIGKDDQQDWDEEMCFCQKCAYQPNDNRDCICVITNKLRAEQRKRIGL